MPGFSSDLETVGAERHLAVERELRDIAIERRRHHLDLGAVAQHADRGVAELRLPVAEIDAPGRQPQIMIGEDRGKMRARNLRPRGAGRRQQPVEIAQTADVVGHGADPLRRSCLRIADKSCGFRLAGRRFRRSDGANRPREPQPMLKSGKDYLQSLNDDD